jgi:drug/metabolite transporter (DMT)-like permease
MAAPAQRAQATVTGIACGVLVIALFSGFTLVSRIGLTSSLRAWDLAALRFGIGGLLMLPVLLRYGLAGVNARSAVALALFGGLGFALCAYAGFASAPAAHGAVLLHGTLPLSTYVLARTGTGSSARPRIHGVLIIVIGILVMAAESAGQNSPKQLLGDCALLLASFSWSAYGLLAHRMALPPAHSASIVAVLSMCAYLPFFLLLPQSGLASATWRELLAQGLFQGVLIGVVSIFTYSKAVATIGATRTALLTAAVPCVTTLAAGSILHEAVSAPVLLGVGLVTAGMVVSLRSVRRSTAPEARTQEPNS